MLSIGYLHEIVNGRSLDSSKSDWYNSRALSDLTARQSNRAASVENWFRVQITLFKTLRFEASEASKVR